MRLHRFYVPAETAELTHDFWLKDPALRQQWQKVLRYREGDKVVLFDGVQTERLYELVEVANDAIRLRLVTEFERKLPKRHVYLLFSLLKKDKNDWVLQKCTELGVSNFVPIVAERSEKTGFNSERAQKIVIEAAEQCGRSDIPHIREPLEFETAIKEYAADVLLLACDETAAQGDPAYWQKSDKPLGIFIGPEGGWTEAEQALFEMHCIEGLDLGHLTLRAETAAVAAATKIMHN